MLNTTQFDNLLGPKVPMPTKGNVINLLKVNDLAPEDYAQYRSLGLGDILDIQQPQAKPSLEKEYDNELKANLIEFKFLAFKASEKPTSVALPKRIQLQMRFFSFPEIQTDSVSLVMPGVSSTVQEVIPGKTYFLAKDRIVENRTGRVHQERNSTLTNQDLMKVTFEVDPALSGVKDEDQMLAKYLKEGYLQIEVFDADSKFHFASCKLPLFELLRQQKSQVVRAKSLEICEPDTVEYRGQIQIVMSNTGK